MRSRAADLRYVSHIDFGPGVVLGARQADIGDILDVWFPNGKTRAVLPSHLEDAAAPELTKDQRKELRHAVSLYRKAHKRPAARVELGYTKLRNKREIMYFNPGEFEVSEERPGDLQQDELQADDGCPQLV